MATTKKQGDLHTFNVIGNLRHDGDRYSEGDTIQLTAAQAAPLISAGALEVAAGDAKPAGDGAKE